MFAQEGKEVFFGIAAKRVILALEVGGFDVIVIDARVEVGGELVSGEVGYAQLK